MVQKVEEELNEVPLGEIKTLKGFRKSKDLEDFYRFVSENGLRREALHALEYIYGRLNIPLKKKGKTRRARGKKKIQ